jgi:hypothetical protein
MKKKRFLASRQNAKTKREVSPSACFLMLKGVESLRDDIYKTALKKFTIMFWQGVH